MMHRLLKNVKGMTLAARDGEIGRITDVYFDDAEWTCRYLVVKTGGWLNQRHVLLTPHSLRGIDWARADVEVDLTREQIRRSPDIDTEKPVSRQNEITYFNYYGYPFYWTGPYVWGPFPTTLPPTTRSGEVTDEARQRLLERRAREREQFDPHLRSVHEVAGYKIEADDGHIGEVQDVLFDEEDWTIRFLVIDTRKWLPGRHVLVPVSRVQRVSWGERAVAVDLTKDEIRSSPEYDPDATLSPELEANLHSRYGRPQAGYTGLR